MRKIICLIIGIFFYESIFPVAHRGLQWANMNCWMISCLSALINTKPLYEMLKDYKVEILAGDSPELKIQKEILKEFIKIMNESFSSGPSPVSTADFYKKIYEPTHEEDVYDPAGVIIGKKTVHSYDFEWGKFAYVETFCPKFLRDINFVYPKLEELFIKSNRDLITVKACYNGNDLLHETYEATWSGDFIYGTGSILCLDLNNKKMPDITAPFNLVERSFVKWLVREGILSDRGDLPQICKEGNCGTSDEYKGIMFDMFKKAPRIMIFHNFSMNWSTMGKFGVKMPDSFNIPKEFFVKTQNYPVYSYKLYSIIIGSGTHFWNYSRDMDQDEWWKYTYSSAEKCAKGTVEKIMETGLDGTAFPVYIFYELENYDEYNLKVKLNDLKESLITLKTKLSELKSKLELVSGKLVIEH
ncbi:MAG: hypothetical protein V1646_00600 [bacterium]